MERGKQGQGQHRECVIAGLRWKTKVTRKRLEKNVEEGERWQEEEEGEEEEEEEEAEERMLTLP